MTARLSPCAGRCHRLQTRDELRAAAAAVGPDHPNWAPLQARALLADANTCTVFSRCPGNCNPSNNEGAPDATPLH